ncbi:hypothetical protein UlMin_002772 [Ulmus minor]
MSGGSEEAANAGADEQAIKLAVAISFLRSKFLQQSYSSSSDPSQSDALRWKQKAKERKQKIFRLREDFNNAEDASEFDLFPQNAACKCYFFDRLGNLSPTKISDGSDRRFNDMLRSRFLRQVRFKERRRRRRTGGSQLRASVDFLVELCDTVSPVESNFANWSHQAVDFILASLRNLLSVAKNMEVIEGIVSSLIVRLAKKMCSPWESNCSNKNPQLYIQHLIRKLGSESYIGQCAILSVSQRISVLAESLLFTDPFDVAFPHMHNCMFIMIELIDFLVLDYLPIWSKDEGFDNVLFEEWLASILQARKASELLKSRNGLYVLYMDRVTGELAKHVSQVLSLHNTKVTKPDILDNLLW